MKFNRFGLFLINNSIDIEIYFLRNRMCDYYMFGCMIYVNILIYLKICKDDLYFSF